MKRIFILLIAVVLLPAAGFAQSGKTGNLTWSIAGGTLTISGNGAMDYEGTAPWYAYREKFVAVVIKDGVTSIRHGAFYWYYGSVTSVIIPASVTNIGNFAFENCSSLISVTLPAAGLTDIGNYAFNACSSLASVTLPNSVTSIGVGAFQFCSSLASVTLPNGVTSIGESAFLACNSLTDVTVKWAMPLSITSSVFAGLTLRDVTLHVPAGTASLYRAAPVWKEFRITEEAYTGIQPVDGAVSVYVSGGGLHVVSPSAEQVEVYSVGGALLYRGVKPAGETVLPAGLFRERIMIVRGSGGWVKKVANV